MIKNFFVVLLLIFVFLISPKHVFATIQCKGSTSFTYPISTCEINQNDGCYYCKPQNPGSGTASCGWNDGRCQSASDPDSDCTPVSCSVCSDDYKGYFEDGDCWTCNDQVCDGTTSCTDPPCGSTVESCSCPNECNTTKSWTNTVACNECTETENACGWTDWNCKPDTCKECVTCSPLCGQARYCGVNCANTDDGAPAAPALVSPLGTEANPANVYSINVALDWNTVSKADEYQARVLNSVGTSAVWTGSWIGGDGDTSGTLEWGKIYQWQARARNTTCGTDEGVWSTGQYFMVDYVPTLESITLKNSIGTVVVPDAMLRNNICQKGFMYDPLPRRVIVEAVIKDTDPEPDGVKNATLSWNGNDYPLSLGPRVGNLWIGTTTIDYPVSWGSQGPFNWTLQASDLYVTSNPIDSGRGWKIWDCQVPVEGTIYDGSGGQACPNVGFSIPVDSRLEFNSLIYKDVIVSDDVAMAVTSPATYGVTNVIYGKDYLPLFNGGDVSNIDGSLMGTGRVTRSIDLGFGTTMCPGVSQFNLENLISAYVVSPRARVDFSYIRDQEGWFQVGGAGVKTKINLDSGVPVTVLPLSNRALCVSGTYSDNALISYGNNFRNINGFNDDSAYGIPNNWWVNNNTNDSSNFNYQNLYNTFYIDMGVGITGINWSSHPSEGVYFVNGDLNIDNDFALDSGKSFIVITRGKIIIADTVSRIDGMYIADGGIEALGTSADQLVINGVLYSQNNIRLARSFENKRLNNVSPAVKINYQPNLLFNLPGSLMRVLSGWREE